MIVRLLLFGLLAGCAVSWVYWLVAWRCLSSVVRRRHRSASAYEPMVSLLKPVKGMDPEAARNFASFCRQEYPDFELLFGVVDDADPAVSAIEELKSRFPDLRIRLIVADRIGANPKASILHRLTAEARGEVLVLSDADIRVGDDYLRRVVAPLRDPAVGLVTCLYRGESPRNWVARLAALHMDASFAPSACLGWKLGTPVGMGATMAMRAADLKRAGGFKSFADFLLDDYEAARRLAELGLQVHLSDCVVASVLGPQRFLEQWRREVRWSRGIRTSHPIQYPGLIVTFGTPLAIAAACLGGAGPWAWIALAISLLVRWFVAWRCARLLGQRDVARIALLPLRDVLSAVVWLSAFVGRRVNWRGHEYELRPDGRLRPLPTQGAGDGVLAGAVRRLDAVLRRRNGIFEFTDDNRCLLRAAAIGAADRVVLSDGTRVEPGDAVGELHLWNEHLPPLPPDGPDLRWAMHLREEMRRSLALLARAAQRDPRLSAARAFVGTSAFVGRRGEAVVARLVERFGFERIDPRDKPGLVRRLHDLGENLLILGLQWTYNPAGLKGKTFFRPRERFWISRDALTSRYALEAPNAPERAPEPTRAPDSAPACEPEQREALAF